MVAKNIKKKKKISKQLMRGCRTPQLICQWPIRLYEEQLTRGMGALHFSPPALTEDKTADVHGSNCLLFWSVLQMANLTVYRKQLIHFNRIPQLKCHDLTSIASICK